MLSNKSVIERLHAEVNAARFAVDGNADEIRARRRAKRGGDAVEQCGADQGWIVAEIEELKASLAVAEWRVESEFERTFVAGGRKRVCARSQKTRARGRQGFAVEHDSGDKGNIGAREIRQGLFPVGVFEIDEDGAQRGFVEKWLVGR